MLATQDNDDAFTREFRHEQVVKFIKALVDGSMKLVTVPPSMSESTMEGIIKMRVSLLKAIEDYVSGRLHGEDLEMAEHNIFQQLVIMRMNDGIEDTVSQSQMENYMDEIRARIDSTNGLLLELLKIFKSSGDKHE